MKKPGICCPVFVNKKYNIVNSHRRKNKLIMPLLREQLALFIPKQQPIIGYREVANVF